MFPSYDEVLNGIRPEFTALEQERLRIVMSVKMHGSLVLFGAVLVAIFLLVELVFTVFTLFAAIALVVYIMIASTLSYSKYQKHRMHYKKQVVEKMSCELLRLCKLPDETPAHRYECSYNHNLRISNDFIRESRIFDFTIDKIEGEDRFSGILGLTEFQFSEITLIQVQTHTNSKGHTTRRNVTMFDGILFIADFHKDFEGVTVLRSANMFNTGAVAAWLQPVKNMLSFLSSEKKHSIDLESEEFNKAFDVQTTDEIKARYILSSSMMERILNFKMRHREKVEISFVESRMYVALSSGRNFFEPKLFQSITAKQAKVVYEDLIFFYGMIEEFDLNTRIWNKE